MSAVIAYLFLCAAIGFAIGGKVEWALMAFMNMSLLVIIYELEKLNKTNEQKDRT